MYTNGEIASRVVNDLKGLTKDAHISWRFIIGVAKTKAKFLMSQKLDELTLFREEDIITTISCFKMKPIEVKDCGIVQFQICDSIMESCEDLPEGLFGKNGSGILSVTNMDGTKSYNYITPNSYTNLRNRKYKTKSTYFSIENKKLRLLDSKNELVNIRIITLDSSAENTLSACSDSDICTSYWDEKFICPDRFLDLVVRDTLQELSSIYRTSQEDENPNMDVNQKTQTVK